MYCILHKNTWIWNELNLPTNETHHIATAKWVPFLCTELHMSNCNFLPCESTHSWHALESEKLEFVSPHIRVPCGPFVMYHFIHIRTFPWIWPVFNYTNNKQTDQLKWIYMRNQHWLGLPVRLMTLLTVDNPKCDFWPIQVAH